MLTELFKPRDEPFELKVFENMQVFNFEGLKRRLLSSPYMPTKDDTGYEPMINDLQTLFNSYQQDGRSL
ncbi:hypothetical protein AB6735_00295 [Mucilaginibacter sp. RCC_168]|uniref:hypothetical protein n=1 Tax=Mucilaginibacter sp. RCC_168 TaxID=3239221 RepID=UPI003526649B